MTAMAVQAKDLGGLGSASGGTPCDGGTSGVKNDSEAFKSGMNHRSGARAAPQQAMPAAPPQQSLPQPMSNGGLTPAECGRVAAFATATDAAVFVMV